MARIKHFYLPLALGAFVAGLSGCAGKAKQQPAEPTVTETELRAWCPPVDFQGDTAFYTVYAPGAEGDAGRVNYQAVISDFTRTCEYPGGKLVLNIRAAGRVVPGAQFHTGNVTMPIRIRIVENGRETYSKVYGHTVSLARGAAKQFIFSSGAITMPQPQKRNVKVYVGFDVRQKQKPRADNGEERDLPF